MTVWNKHVEDEKKRLYEEMENEKNIIRAAKLARDEFEKEKQKLDEDLAMLKSDREMLREQAGKMLLNHNQSPQSILYIQ